MCDNFFFQKIMRAECVDTRSKAMEMLTIEQLCTLLKYALERMKHAGVRYFIVFMIKYS